MSKEKLEVGDVVVYKLGKDIPMTVSIIKPTGDQTVCCQFLIEGYFHKYWFTLEELEFVRH